jgi:hypothetical protein
LPDHAGHDRWLVVRWTTDPADLTPAETTQARSLLAGCADCAALSADLETISRATATSVVPARPRDFRLTPEQAASSRGSILDRLRRWLGTPGAFAVRPLAGAALAIGLVLVIVAPNVRPAAAPTGDATGGANPAAAASALAEPGATQAAAQRNSYAKETPEGVAGAGPEMDVQAAPTGASASENILMTRVADSAQPSQAADSVMADHRAAASPDGVAGEMAPDDGTKSVPEADPDAGQAERAPATSTADAAADSTTFALTLLGIVLAGTGLMVLLFAWLARRWQDPLLR